MSIQEIPNSYRRIDCICKCHNNVVSTGTIRIECEHCKPIVNQSWEEKFYKEFQSKEYDISDCSYEMHIKQIKSFISQLLIDQKREWVDKIKKLEFPAKESEDGSQLEVDTLGEVIKILGE